MSSHFCLSCFFPVYPVNSNRGREVYVCLTEDCRNFKVSVPEFETFVDFRQEMIYEPNYAAEPSDYPVEPLEDERPATEGQLDVAHPHTEQLTYGESDYQDYLPEAEYIFTPGENQDFEAQPQSGREEPMAVPQSPATPGATNSDSRKTRGKRNDPAEQSNSVLEKAMERAANRGRPRPNGGDHQAKRELNPFILYRKAYKDVVKMAGVQSFGTMAAESWAMESASVRAQFSALANTEKRLHKKAFPDYKYVPKRIHKKKGKK